MANQLELRARAALCKQLAKREPTNRVLWMAEAENWSRLSNENLRGEPEQKPVTASWPISAWQEPREKGPRMHGPPSGGTQQMCVRGQAGAFTQPPTRREYAFSATVEGQ
jgi:hypothetical protein